MEYFYFCILNASELTDKLICCTYGMTTKKDPYKYLRSSRYNGKNKISLILLVLPVYNGRNEENKFRHYMENIQKEFKIIFEGDLRNEYFDILNINYKNIEDEITKLKSLVTNYINFSNYYDNNIIKN